MDTDNGIEVLVLHGATMLGGTDSTPKSDTVVIINGNKIYNFLTKLDQADMSPSNDCNFLAQLVQNLDQQSRIKS